MSKGYVYYAADGTRFSSITARDNYNKKLEERKQQKEKEESK